jgi:hypothetical protein
MNSWDELKPKEIKALLPLVLQLRGLGDNADLAIEILRKCTKVLNMDPQKIEELSWLWNTKIRKKPFRFVRIGWRFFLLPAPNFSNTTAIEMAMCNIYYLKFLGEKNKKGVVVRKPDFAALSQLMAVLCRPIGWQFLLKKISNKWDGDYRTTYNSTVSDRNAELFKKLPIGEALAVLNYWESMNEEFIKMYETLFDADEGGRQLFRNGEGWLSTLEDVAKDGVHGNFKEVCNLNTHTVFMYLKHRKIIRLEEIRQSETD